MFSQAAALFSPLTTLAPGIPVWDQYVRLLQEVLDFLANSLQSAGLAVIVFTIMFYNFPSGLNIYWLSSMLLGILQQKFTTGRLKKA